MYTILFLDICGYSYGAKEILDNKNLPYKLFIFSSNINNGKDKYFQSLNKKYKVGKDKNGNTVYDKHAFKDMFGEDATFPRVYKGEKLIGGYEELEISLKNIV